MTNLVDRLNQLKSWLIVKVFLPKEQFEVVNGRRICYVRTGHGPHNLVCIPGMLSSWHAFAKQLLKLDPNSFTVVSLDLPGYGQSLPLDRKNPPECYEDDAQFTHALMEKLNLLPYSVLGWSDGGMAAIFLAHQQQANTQVDRLILCAANSYVCEPILTEYVRYSAALDADETIYTTLLRENPLFGQWCSYAYMKAIVRGQMESMKRLYEEEDGEICQKLLPDITNETLVIHGATDDTPVMHATLIADALPNCKGLEIQPTGGHLILLFDDDWCNERITRFLLAGRSKNETK